MCVDYSQTINLFTNLDAYPLPRIDDLVTKLATYNVFSTFDLKSAYHQIPIEESQKVYPGFEAGGKLWEFNRIPFGIKNGVPQFQRKMDEVVTEAKLTDTFPYLDNVTIGGHNQQEHDKNVNKFLKAIKHRNLTLNEAKTVSSVNEINILGYCVGNGSIRPDPERLKPLKKLPIPHNMSSLKRTLGLFAYYARWIPKFSDKIQRLKVVNNFPLDGATQKDFQSLKDAIAAAALSSIDKNSPFVVDRDASDVVISATLNQSGRPVAFMSRTLQGSERFYPAIEKEATAVNEAVRKWSHLLARQHFILVTDQKSVAFIFDSRKRSKIKNYKIQCWRLELASFSYSIRYRPGQSNVGPDALTRAFCASIVPNLQDLHEKLCHPGVRRLSHFVRAKNYPYSKQGRT